MAVRVFILFWSV